MTEPQTTEANPNAGGTDAGSTTGVPSEGTTQKAMLSESTPKADEPVGSKPEQQTEAPKPKAPETYKFNRPEGLPEEYQLDDEVLSTFSESARELDLSQEQAQTVIDKLMPKLYERGFAQQDAIRAGWIEQSKSDKEFGGEKLAENLETAKLAISKLGTPELMKLLDSRLGLGDHPEVVRFMVRVGKMLKEDSHVPPSRASNSPVDPYDDAALAQKLYPSMTRGS